MPLSQDICYEVAIGNVAALKAILSNNDKRHPLLTNPHTFTDPAGRKFHCMLIVYVYWRNDTLFALLAKHMDETILKEALWQIKYEGLWYTYKGEEIQEFYFNIQPLLEAYQACIANAEGHSSGFFHKPPMDVRVIRQLQQDLPANYLKYFIGDTSALAPSLQHRGVWYRLPQDLKDYLLASTDDKADIFRNVGCHTLASDCSKLSAYHDQCRKEMDFILSELHHEHTPPDIDPELGGLNPIG